MGGAKYYNPAEKSEVICEQCYGLFKTARRNQRFCRSPECQIARKKANLERWIVNKAKKLTEGK